MKYGELVFSRNRHLTILEKNGVNKLFDDKAKRMQDSLRESLSDVIVLEIDESVGLTIVTLDIGKTIEELNEERRISKEMVDGTRKRIMLETMTLMAAMGGNVYE